ncbi:right-handed parallel beta-helix repeat-containing protein [Caulobacter sp. 17J80-11]|nr:right-handed parallel beta-helix repeat-containing protein [Caulobacter sp. 17J80-11]
MTAAEAAERLVRTQDEFRRAVDQAAPGDEIVLANGEWRDFEILLRGHGVAKAPITLRAEQKGRVFITGRSNLRLAGENLVVSGLVFRDGWTPSGEVIAFRGKAGEVARASRVTEVVIDRFNNPNRLESDHWIALYGEHNRFDHSQIVGKANLGATLVVIREPEYGLENHHRIDHNWFGPRPNLGSNGGETIRIGTSGQSLSPSYTLVEDNWFERTDGEIEIISVKSGSNVIRGNVFVESRGALTLRHGNGNLVENNVFFGRGKPHTGGVRVINRDQTVRNNYMEGLAGGSNASALAVMNGVPNSPINRYHQVVGAVIEHNTIVDAASVEFGAGADAERSLPPAGSRFVENLMVSDNRVDPLRARAAVDGIVFDGNVQSEVDAPALVVGFRRAKIRMERAANGLLYPVDRKLGAVGVRRDLQPVAREATGVDWYPKTQALAALGSGRVIPVGPEEGALAAAIRAAGPGDTLALAPGRYVVEEVLAVSRPLTVQGPAPAAGAAPGEGLAVEIAFTRPTLFQIEEGGALHLKNLAVSGRRAPDATGDAVVRTTPRGLLASCDLIIEGVRVADLDVNGAFDVVSISKGSLAERVVLKNSVVENVTGSVIKADAETDELGFYNVERLEILDTAFRGVAGEIADVYRGGTDESTFGPDVLVRGNRIEGSGRGPRNTSQAAIDLHGVQKAVIEQNEFRDSGVIEVLHTVGAPSTRIVGNRFERTPEPKVADASKKVEAKLLVSGNTVVGEAAR